MSKPGARKMDQIVSITPGDIHIIMIPSPGVPVPTPIPHPCASMIKDNVAKKVKVMGQPGAVKGSKSKHTPPHIPMGPGPFQKPPMNAGKIITGSSNVFYEGKEAAMFGDTGEMCSDPSNTPVGKVIGTAATVYVGGGGSGGGEAREKANVAAMKAAKAACHEWVNDNIPEGPEREAAHRALCTAAGDPVDVATGKMMKRHFEIRLNGRMPIELATNYSSARAGLGALGASWRHSFEIELIVESDFIAMRDENSRFTPFMRIEEGQETNAEGDTTRLAHHGDCYVVTLATGVSYKFPVPQGSTNGKRIPVAVIHDRWDNGLHLNYAADGRLHTVCDDSGRTLEFHYEARGLLTHVFQRMLRHEPETGRSVRFHYAEKSPLLTAVEDEAGNLRRYEYSRHLLTRAIDRNGDWFCFQYDKDGWCTRTWGEGGLLDRTLEYDRDKGRTRVIDSLGYTRVYHWDENGLVREEHDHVGKVLRFEYDDAMQCVKEENAEGDVWSYAYDEGGRLVKLETPEGAAKSFKYDEQGRLVGRVGFLGAAATIEYSDDGLVRTETDAFGGQTVERRASNGDVLSVRRPDGSEVHFVYDAVGNCIEMHTPAGLNIRRRFDHCGDLVYEEDQFGRRVEIEYDAAGFPLVIRKRDEREVRLHRDREGQVIQRETGDNEIERYTLGPVLGTLDEVEVYHRTDRDSAMDLVCRRVYTRDTECRLVRLESLPGTSTEIEYGEHGHSRRIRFGDGREHEFLRDGRGFISELRENGAMVFRQQVDAMGCVTTREMADGEEFSFEYDAIGNLLSGSSTGASLPVSYERDAFGRIVTQQGAAGTFAFEYDSTGAFRGYSLEEDLSIEFTPEYAQGGRRLRLSGTGGGSASLQYDERDRLCSIVHGSAETTERRYDSADRLVESRWTNPAEETLNAVYGFDAFGLLASVEPSNGLITHFERDGQKRLIACSEESDAGIATTRWEYDGQGNRCQETRPDGAIAQIRFEQGNRPIAVDDRSYTYDCRGRVVAIESAESDIALEVDVHGRTTGVTRPDGGKVSIAYDVLGRRVESTSETGTRRFFWVGDNLVHEQAPDGSQSHYLYEPGSHVPIALLTAQDDGFWEWNAVRTDSRGAPDRVSNATGEAIWSGTTGPWGNRPSEEGLAVMPLGLLGQYHDAETGLVHNGARIYDPASASYLSPDPIGLAGGLNHYGYVHDPVTFSDPLGLNPEVVALGIQNPPIQYGDQIFTNVDGLRKFAGDPAGDQSVKAEIYEKFDPVPGSGDKPGIPSAQTVRGAMKDSKEIHFNLEGMGVGEGSVSVETILNDPDPSKYTPPSTNWELATVLSDPELRGKTTFYDGPGQLSEKIPCTK
jgi:RHS repeat-associated protein